MYALSAALCKPIQSYYPPQLNSKLSSAFTRNVCGRNVAPGSNSSITLMLTSVLVPVVPKDLCVLKYYSCKFYRLRLSL